MRLLRKLAHAWIPGLVLGARVLLAQEAPVSFEGLPGPRPAPPPQPSPQVTALRVPRFDPFRDVPTMQNWVPDTDFDGGAAHCFAMTMLTYYSWRRLEFTALPGLPPSQWTESTPLDTPIALDEDGMHFVMDWAFAHPERRIRVGGAASLRDFTAPGTETEQLFRRIAEALQFSMQIPTNIGRYLRNIAFASVELVPGERYTRAGVNRRAYEELKGRLEAGLLAPFTAHPGKPKADGHVLLAYSLREDTETAELELYDSNYPPTGDRARPGKLVFDKADWSYQLHTSTGHRAYGSYELITPLRPDRAYERHVFWQIVTHLDEYLAATSWIFDRLAEAQDLGDEAKRRWQDARTRVRDEVIPGWRRRAEAARSRTRVLRRRLGLGD